MAYDARNWAPRHSPMEWWYVSGVDTAARRAFHVAFFRAYAPEDRFVLGIPARRLMRRPGVVAHVAVTDLDRDQHSFEERRSIFGLAAHASASPHAASWWPVFRVSQEGWSLRSCGDGQYRLEGGDIDLRLRALRPPVIHPPGYSGTDAVGRMAYQSVTRLEAVGRIRGAPFSGTAWMDHQWGDMMPSATATWDWCGLHDTKQGLDLVLYQVHDSQGRVVQTLGTVTDARGQVQPLVNLQITPHRTWVSPTGRAYRIGLTVKADGLSLETTPLRLDQEIRSKTTELFYWEGPVRFSGTWQGRALGGHGTTECLHGRRLDRTPTSAPRRSTDRR